MFVIMRQFSMWLVDSLIDCSKTIGFLADVMVS